ncbi:helix-hairpin-helix domain-containing protein [Vallitalea guaymasensis]|uniref:helix-hairpin-helix domain-containing protein n=1 Tax=Vallitalea guaymasensis TaxID=1185412 RepID=UPI002729729F|nr:helix-hairpin-helix domain-containing protein [Vallitalea guaymasensis]
MKKYLRFISITMMLLIIINLSNFSSLARPITFNDMDITLAKVVEVISGEAIKVIEEDSNSNKTVKLIKMIGIDTDSSTEAMEYTYNRLLGKRVMLLPDSKDSTFDKLEGWSYKYVYLLSSKSLSEELLEQGLANLDDSYNQAEQYSDLDKAMLKAKEEKKGIWENYNNKNATIGVNINTATYTDLVDVLEDTTSSMAYSIVNYRKYNPFNSVEEIKFCNTAFTKEWFDKNRNKMSVISNISTASFEELKSLFNDTELGDKMAKNIVEYRLYNLINSLYEVRRIPGMYHNYSKVEEFIALKPVNDYVEKEIKVVNLNTASIKQIRRTCFFSVNRADQIVKERNNQKYIIKSLGELEKKGYISRYEINRYSDNFSLLTNINTAKEYELESLFGFIDIKEETRDNIVKRIVDNRPYTAKNEVKSIMTSAYYDKLKPYIYAVDSEIPEYININITDRYNAVELFNMNDKEAEKYLKNRIRYTFSKNINFDYANYVSDFSLFTNLNTASRYELENIYGRVWKDSKYQYVRIPKEIIDDIISFREDQPFCSLDEVSEIFSKHKQKTIYNNIKDYLVFY